MRFVLLLLLAIGSGCDAGRAEPEAHHQDTEQAGTQSETEPDVELYDSRGTLLWAEAGRVYLNHEEIPGFMDAMAMGYDLDDPSIAEGIEPGTTVLFRVVVEPDGHFYIDQMARESEKSTAP